MHHACKREARLFGRVAMTMAVLGTVLLGVLVFGVSPAQARYVTWSTAGANAGTGGPHQNYQLATQKCGVCHAVHNAAISNSTSWGPSPTGSGETQMLLRSSVADACTYCHIDTNIGGLQIYGGLPTKYATDDVYGHNGSTAATCADCHAVHGADIFQGAIARKILQKGGAPSNTNGNVQVEAAAAYSAMNGGDLYNGNVNLNAQVSGFCTKCHKVWTDASETTITASGIWQDSSGAMGSFTNAQYKAHPLKTAGATFSAKGAKYTGKVAWANAEYCRSCHAAGLTEQAGVYTGVVVSSFPHYTPARARFLTSGWGAADASATAMGIGNAVNDPNEDGVCLRCHRNGSASGNSTAGVGIGF